MPTQKSRTISLYWPYDSLREDLDRLSMETGLTVSQIARQAIAAYLAEWNLGRRRTAIQAIKAETENIRRSTEKIARILQQTNKQENER